MARRRGGRAQEAWWADEPQAVPNVPENARRGGWPRRLWTVYVWAAVALFPIAVASVVFAFGGNNEPAGAVADQTSSQVDVDSAQAQVAVQTWLGQDPAPLPGGRILGFNGSSSLTPDPVNGEAAGYDLVTYRFLLTDTAYRLYEASVQMAVADTTGAVPIATPAVVPLPGPNPGSTAGDVWPWPGVEQGPDNGGYQTAIETWLAAYTTGTPAELKQTVGDPDETRSYQPLTGAAGGEFTITNIGNRWGEGQDRQTEDRPAQVQARVTMLVQWAPTDTEPPAEGEGEEPVADPTPMTMDLLLDRANTGAPIVVAWATPGQSLAAYQNGSPMTPTTSGSPDSTPDPDGTPDPSATPTS